MTHVLGVPMRRSLCFFLLLVFILMTGVPDALLYADYKQAVAFYNQGQYDKAIQELKPDIEKNPDWEFGHRLLGLCYLSLNNNALAVNSLSRAVELKSTAYSTYFGLGQAYFNMQKYEDCVTALDKGEKVADKEKVLDKEKARLYKLRGSAHFRMNRFNEAVSDITNSLRLNPSDWADFSMLGFAYYNLNRNDEAIQALEKALSMQPDQSPTSDLLGKAYFKKGIAALSEKQYGAAVEGLIKAKKYDPQNGYILYNLAEAYLFQKQYLKAENALKETIGLMPGNADAYGRMGLVYEKQKKWDSALNAYKKAEEISPSKELKEAIERVAENKKR
jgi:tetratricopeptide (TPR) repeat protein